MTPRDWLTPGLSGVRLAVTDGSHARHTVEAMRWISAAPCLRFTVARTAEFLTTSLAGGRKPGELSTKR